MSAVSESRAPSQEQWHVVRYRRGRIREEEEKKAGPSVREAFSNLSLHDAHRPAKHPSFVKIARDVHQDDIHSILKVAQDRFFITGSKDGSLKKWNPSLECTQVIYEPSKIDYQSWITTLSTLGESEWMSGTRDGYVTLWNAAGQILAESSALFSSEADANCKARNARRVNCLVDMSGFHEDPHFLIGWPTQFSCHQKRNFETLHRCQTSSNDWVYSVHPLSFDKLLVVTGCNLDLWEYHPESDLWSKGSLIAEPKRKKCPQRPFISKITPFPASSDIGLAVFDGSVQIFDVERQRSVFMEKGHQKRVWTIEPFDTYCFASCADDGLIKIWDRRTIPTCTATLEHNLKVPARVSVLANLSEHYIVSGSCPDDVQHLREKASLILWDKRKI